jgi:hypothetical protein
MENEKNTERYLYDRVRDLGGEAYKFVSPMRRFVLDRLCVLPKGKVWFVEVKSEGQTPCEGQIREIDRLHAKGHRAVWVKTKAEVDVLIHLMKEDIANDGKTNGKSTATDQ